MRVCSLLSKVYKHQNVKSERFKEAFKFYSPRAGYSQNNKSNIGSTKYTGNLSQELIDSDSLYYTYSLTNQEGIYIEKANKDYDLNFWENLINDEDFDEEMEAAAMEEHVFTILTELFNKYFRDRTKILMLIYSLTNPLLKDHFIFDLEFSFYRLITKDRICNKVNLGYIGYQSLLNSCFKDNTSENRKSLEKIMAHIDKNYYIPENDNIAMIIEICRVYKYNKYLKEVIEYLMDKKKVRLSENNSKKYNQVIGEMEGLKLL